MNDRLSYYGDPAVSGGNIRINANTFIGSADNFKEDLTLNLTVPFLPTSGDVRTWGLQQIATSSKAIFNITDTTFSCKCVYKGVTTTINIPWQSAWTATAVDYTIKWNGFSADFLINGIRPKGALLQTSGTTTVSASTTITGSGTSFLTQFHVGDVISVSSASTTYATVVSIASATSMVVDTAIGDGTSQTIGILTETFINDATVPKVAMSTYINNGNSDNLDLNYREDQNVQGYLTSSGSAAGPFQSAYNFYPIRSSLILTNSYVAGTVLGLGTLTSGVVNLNNQLILYVQFTLGSLTTGEIKVEFSNDNATWVQETYDDIATSTGIATERSIVRTFAASGSYRIPIQINDKYIRISAHGTGTVTSSLMQIDAIIGNN